jgi:hypothetical protein
MKENEKKQEQARLVAAKEAALPEPTAKSETVSTPAISTTAAVPTETGPALQHVHLDHFDQWIADMDLDDDEVEDQGLLDQVDQWNAAMSVESGNSGQHVVEQPVTSASDMESEEEETDEKEVSCSISPRSSAGLERSSEPGLVARCGGS